MTTQTRREIQRIAEQNLNLVRKIASRFSSEAETFDDFVSIGTIGLMKAVERFDESKGFAFSTFAVPYIKGEILHYIRSAKGELIRHRRGERRQYIQSLDAPLSSDSETTRLDIVADDLIVVEPDDEQVQLKAILNQLTYPSREVLLLTQLNGLRKKEAAAWFEVDPTTIQRWLSKAQVEIEAAKQDHRFKTQTYKRERNALPYRDDISKELVFPEFKSRCQVCDRIFALWKKPSRIPQTCSSVCARKLSAQANSINIWSDAELDFLKSRIGKMPTAKIYESFHVAAAHHGWTDRTDVALKVKITRLAKSVKCVDDGWSMTDLAKRLDVPVDRIRVWKKRGLKTEMVARGITGQCVIYRVALHEFCTEHFWRFSGIDIDRLSEILGDRALAEKCAAQPLKKKRVEVQDLRSKKIYRSAREAARVLGVERQFVLREIKREENALLKQSHVETIGHSELVPSIDELKRRTSLIDPSLPMKVRVFRSPDGKLYETNNLNWFAQVHGLQSPLLSSLANGFQDSHLGWTRPFGSYQLRLITPSKREDVVVQEGTTIFDLNDPGDRLRAYLTPDEGMQVFVMPESTILKDPETKLREYAKLHRLEIICCKKRG
ncbi:sigma factor SigF [Leptolyngbya boryana NIES-2135]|jgi:RNA polymerase sigma factor (sigma-70 family)|uniref:Sigma factor SigF n=1 Tax=Leptolyngbya boryana NIES-2135 TaxID=1973484 RepID=A0A1Z4JP93_LEPBY|nr:MULTISPECIES: sigma-70 family RNA polymerase sigma factor [Leptolyngbya]BAY58477.1 sigma factor SigF [Leptolyngbya boryana NIES-2135]MBD2370951.1 sigma-70 family RNA polymerase sigma factor [Leptolyngbya sp. FACHB-161]MBD2377465.1 sigma-70 family RNA polymerase sigma factor [Leptolyngbya sp. FACHB-238]MBD2401873.1 sigma-70 family RNA polymerase sigma factor [Leptolyngbya sp. FACHB-239]MBD2408391.1 sigma-70 family RNA polymerase sigma factor [Leptolyngbya sp. FACHB-402]